MHCPINIHRKHLNELIHSSVNPVSEMQHLQRMNQINLTNQVIYIYLIVHLIATIKYFFNLISTKIVFVLFQLNLLCLHLAAEFLGYAHNDHKIVVARTTILLLFLIGVCLRS